MGCAHDASVLEKFTPYIQNIELEGVKVQQRSPMNSVGYAEVGLDKANLLGFWRKVF